MHAEIRRTRRAARRSRRDPRAFWLSIGAIWMALVWLFAASANAQSPFQTLALTAIGVASSAIWLNGIRYFAMWATRPLWTRVSSGQRRTTAASNGNIRVALLYCTADDFNPDALRASMNQRHAVTAVILDDSATRPMRDAVDLFSLETGTEIVRRSERTGYKAGNLNNGISRVLDQFDYFVVLDSDGVIPPDFVDRALSGFAADASVGIVQGRHLASPGETAFTAAFGGVLGSHLKVSQLARSRVGFAAFMGRGAMISSDCYRATGPFPEVVTEDLAFSLNARLVGFRIAYDHTLVCSEDYPIDYHSFRTQHAKLVEGTTEFLRGNWRLILRSKLRVSEKVDLLLEQLMVPVIAVASLVLVLATLLLAALGDATHQPIWSIPVTAACATAPLLPEAVRLARRRSLGRAAGFLALATALYGSTLLVTLRASLKVIFGGAAVFRVTPKRVMKATRWSKILALRLELIAAGVAVLIALPLTGTLVPAVPIVGPAFAALCFAMLGAIPVRPTDSERTPHLATR